MTPRYLTWACPGAAGKAASTLLESRGVQNLVLADGPAGLRLSRSFVADSQGNIIPGLETAMQDKEAGAGFSVDVPAAEAYGERREGLNQRIPKKHFGNQPLQPGRGFRQGPDFINIWIFRYPLGIFPA